MESQIGMIFEQLARSLPGHCHPQVTAAESHVRIWVRECGLVTTQAAADGFAAARFGEFAARFYPQARDIFPLAEWMAWLFLLDDQIDDGLLDPHGESGQRVLHDILAVPAAMPVCSADPFVMAFAELWPRLAGGMPESWRRRFLHHLTNSLESTLQEAANRRRGIVPTLAQYLRMRRHTGATLPCFDLIEADGEFCLPDAALTGDLLSIARRSCSEFLTWTNDIVSLAKDDDCEVNNIVLVLQQQYSLDRTTAVERAVSKVYKLESEFRSALSSLAESKETDRQFTSLTSHVTTYLTSLRDTMGGTCHWYCNITRRYASVTSTGDDSP